MNLSRRLKLKYKKLVPVLFKKIKTRRENFQPIPGKTIVYLRRYVTNLQSQIAVELRNKNFIKANSIIRKLLRSKEAHALAVYNTISATGYRSKGLSKIVPRTNEDYRMLMRKLWLIVKFPKTYKASPLSRTYIPKTLKPGQNPPTQLPNESPFSFTNRTERPISVPTYLDRAIQHVYKFALEVICEETQSPTSFGFRPFRSAPWASKALVMAIWTRKGFGPPKFALELDIRKFYDSISHAWVLANCTSINVHGGIIEVIPYEIMDQWLKCGFITKDFIEMGVIPTTGIPQGGPICPVIANVVLNGVEDHIKTIIANAEPPPKRVTPKKDFVYEVFHYGNPFAIITGVTSYKEIDTQIRDLILKENLPLEYPFKLTSMILSHSSPNRTINGWSIKMKKGESLNLNKRKAANNSWSFVARFADDVTLLFNNKALLPIIYKSVNDFLLPRGLNLNLDKCKLVDLYKKEPCLFVGINHALTFKQGKTHIYSFPPPEKVRNLRIKISNILRDTYRDGELIFTKINSILRGWCNYYSSTNASNCFSSLSKWLWTKIYYFFIKKYKRYPSFKRKSQRHFKRKLSSFVWNKHLSNFPQSSTKWWKINPKDQRPTSRKKNPKGLFLVYPKKIKIIYPLLIYANPDKTSPALGLNAFHPLDRIILETKALGWRRGVQYAALRKTNGRCALCDCTLIDCTPETIFELHHCLPIFLGGKYNVPNLLPLCKICHYSVSKAVKTRDLETIINLEQKGVLKEVSNNLSLLINLESNVNPPGE